MTSTPSAPLSGPLHGSLFATTFGFVMVQLDVTIVNVALPRIGAELSAGTAGLQWVVDSYTLAFAAPPPFRGRPGRPAGLPAGLPGGISPFHRRLARLRRRAERATLIWARALQGAGAALLVPALALASQSRLRAQPRGCGREGHRHLDRRQRRNIRIRADRGRPAAAQPRVAQHLLRPTCPWVRSASPSPSAPCQARCTTPQDHPSTCPASSSRSWRSPA